MIDLKNISKKFQNNYVLQNINISFPQYGIVSIYGPSGCGKSTLLNLLSSLYNSDEGDISFYGKHYGAMKEEEKDLLRNSNIGFIFQDFKLFEFETVKSNLLFAIDIKCSDKKSHKERRVKDLLKIVNLSEKEDELVSNLSGGEKQRVTIARAICNSPSVVLADEPTGNLDNENSEIVMSILERIARSALVIVVSHDIKLTKKYADQIVYMKDGKIENIEYTNHNHHVDILPLLNIKPKENKPKLPISFSLSHTFNSIKRRKWRTIIVLLTTSLGLIGVGLGTVLSKIISTNLYKSYSQIIDTNKVVMRSKEKTNKSTNLIKSLSYNEVEYLYDEYKASISNIGVYYWNNFESMFSYYDLSLKSNNMNRTLPEYTIKNFNEYEYISNCKTVIYPNQINAIKNDEVVLGLTYPLLNEICFQLYIQRTVKSLSNYLRGNELYISANLDNAYWGYSNSFLIKVKGFTMSNTNCFYHSNPVWNEYIFEEKCRFTNTDIINSTTKQPWDLKKSYFFEFKNNRDLFLEDVRFKKEHRHVIAEILGESIYPTLYKDREIQDCCRVALLTMDNKNEIDGYLCSYFKKTSKHIKTCIYGSSNGYAIYPESLMIGFSRTTYLSNNLQAIEDVIDLTAYVKYEESNNINVSDDILVGHFSKSSSNGLSFNPRYNLIAGKAPKQYNEIVISQQIAAKYLINSENNPIIYLSFPIKEELLPNGYLLRDYRTVGLKVTGISDSLKYELSHSESWSTMFFQTMIGVSRFDLAVDSIALEIDENTENEVMNSLSKAFPRYEISSPLSSVKESVNTICRYIEIILLILSVSSVIIASLLLSICNYLHYMEIKKDIGLIRCLGISKNESNKFILTHSLVMSFLAFALSSIQLLIICLILSQSLSSTFGIESTFVFNPLSILYMFLLSMVISLVSSWFIKKKINKLDPLECLR